MEKITKETMKTISKNLMIDISEEEANQIYLTIKNSIEEIEKIKEYDFDHIEPMDFPNITTNNSFRDDVIVEFENKEKLLNCAKDRVGKYIKV